MAKLMSLLVQTLIGDGSMQINLPELIFVIKDADAKSENEPCVGGTNNMSTDN